MSRNLKILQEQIFPVIFNNDGFQFMQCIDVDSGGDQLQSEVMFIKALLRNGTEEKQVPLIVKFEPPGVKSKVNINTDNQFYNEVFMYSEVFPFLNRMSIIDNTFAKFYHGVSILNGSDNNVLVLQDLKTLGYKMSEERVVLDYNHIVMAIKELGNFHALSYAAKRESAEEFHRLSKHLRESYWIQGSFLQPVISACFHRAIDPLIEEGKHTEVLTRLLSRIDSSVVNFMLDLVAPEEHMAVICHGDFCRNNILFKYDSNIPTGMKFIDIACARYSSPVVDLMFFLFLNSSREFRQTHWDTLLTVYHNALSTAIPGTLVPTLDSLKDEVLQKALYGFVHCSFFLPVMLYGTAFHTVDHRLHSPEEISRVLVNIGGEECTRLLSDMVEELIDRKCLTMEHNFLLDH